MHILKNSTETLMSLGISWKVAKAIEGNVCQPTGRTSSGLGRIPWTQVEFDGALIARPDPFVLCVPDAALSNAEVSEAADKKR